MLDCGMIYLWVYSYILLRQFAINTQRSLCSPWERNGTIAEDMRKRAQAVKQKQQEQWRLTKQIYSEKKQKGKRKGVW